MSDPTPPTLAFGWDCKLRKTDEFSSVFRFKRVFRGEKLDVHCAPNPLGKTRLGLIVPKKVWPHAVDRNRVKRHLRETFRLGRADWPALDVIVRVKAQGLVQDYRTECARLMRLGHRKLSALDHNG